MQTPGTTVIVNVFDDGQPVETRACRLMVVPDGRRGALWRGLVYPLDPSDRVNVSGPAFPPSLCRAAPSSVTLGAAIIEGEEECYLLLEGNVADCERGAAVLRGRGAAVLRSGRYLGDSAPGIDADWFVRFVRPSDLNALRDDLAEAFAFDRPEVVAGASELRVQLLVRELESARVREAALRAELARSKSLPLAKSHDETDELRELLAHEQAARTAAEAAFAALSASEPVRAPPSPKGAKLKDEIETILRTLLPRLHLVRDSLTTIAVEFSERGALYKAFSELQAAEVGRPPAWKVLHRVSGWWERHVSNGQDDAARIYARLPATDRLWHVLVSHKGQQQRDLDWLARYSA
jgi:hypothetical protein